jgi:putative aldouronate transport system substrate-binding protein
MFLLGDPAPDYDLMLAELNKLVQRDLNATLRVSWIGWGDFSTRYPLVLASGEPIDLIYTSNWAFYMPMASRGAFLPLNDLLPQYAPRTFAELPAAAITQATINDNLYMLPMNYDEINPHGWVVRGDLRRKHNIPEIRSLDDFGAYLDAVAKNEQGMIPFNAGPFDIELQTSVLLYENFWNHKDALGDANFLYDMRDPTARVLHLVETPQYEEFVRKMRTWYLNGYWSRSVLQNRIDARDSLENGRSAALVLNIGTYDGLWQNVNASHPAWDLEWFMMGPDNPTYINPYINNGMAIPATSLNPERAMMFLEKVHQDEDYYNLLFYGIRGRHYELTEDNKLTLPPGVTPENNGYPAGGPCPWGFMNRKFHKESADANPETERIRREVLVPKAIVPTLLSFVFDAEPVKTEYAAIKGLEDQYFKPLNFGLVDNPSAYLAEYREMLRRSGIERVKAEMQRQVDEYLAATR